MSDFRYAIRAFARVPGFTLVAVVTLALGIGATTAIFSLVNAVLVQPLPFVDPQRLVVARGSLPDLTDAATDNRTLAGSGIWATNLYNLEIGPESRQIRGAVTSPEVLPLLGVTPLLGRNFTPEDNQTDTVILGYGLWQSAFAGDPGVLGRTISLTGSSYTVVGVTPPWFRFPSSEYVLWTSLGGAMAKTPAQAKNRSLRIFSLVARLKPEVTIEQAQSDLDGIAGRIAKDFPATNTNVRLELMTLRTRLVGDIQSSLLMLLGAVGLLLLIACANVANLMLARTTVRQREMSIRVALGAGRARLARQLAVESLVLAVSGAALGLLVATWGLDLLPSALEARLPRGDGLHLDSSVLLFAVGATLLTAFFFGVAPALQAATGNTAALQDTTRSTSASRRSRHLRRGIVVMETALAVVVVVGAGLLLRSFAALTSRDPGFDPSRLLTFNSQFIHEPGDAARNRALEAIVDRIQQLPGVEAVGGSSGFPVVTAQRATRFEAEGRTLTGDQDSAYFMAATPDYFKALGVSVQQGRAFSRNDVPAAPAVVIINRTFANSVFAGVDPIGRRIKLFNPEYGDSWRTVVGIVGDLYYQGAAGEPQSTIYTPFAQTPFMWSYVMVRANADPASLTASIRAAVPAAVPRSSAINLRPMRDVLTEAVAEPRLTMLITGSFAALALALAAVGIYGVISYTVAQRTREIGIRRALGARVGDVIKLVMGEGLLLGAAGVALGLAGAALLMQSTSTLLFGVTTRDPVTYASVGGILLATTALASWIPARRATRVEPVTALREE